MGMFLRCLRHTFPINRTNCCFCCGLHFDAGQFFTSLFSKLFGDKEMRILILGLDGAGKTTILYRLQVGEVVKTIPSTLSPET